VRFRGATRPPPVAGGGGSEWRRSADEEGALPPTKMPGTATGQRHQTHLNATGYQGYVIPQGEKAFCTNIKSPKVYSAFLTKYDIIPAGDKYVFRNQRSYAGRNGISDL